jgi:poly(A)-specific ribonuclease
MLHRYLRRSFGTLTRKNWDTESPRFLAALEKAEFVTFDFELTGLYTKPSERFIGVEACYDGYSEGARAFQPVQLGMCTGRRDSNGKWILTPISAYMMPAEDDLIFSSSSATLRFLVDNGIDLNAWISQGVKWLTLAQESDRKAAINQRIDETRALRDAAESAPVKPAPSKPIDLPHEQDRILVESVRKQIDCWLSSGAAEPLDIVMESAFHRLLLHTVIGQEYPQIFSLSGKKGESRVLTVFKSKAELHAKQLAALTEEISRLSPGPRAFFDLIGKRKIPVIGHNCLVDILHACKLYEDLPADLLSFKSRVSKILPLIYDTRILTEQANTPATLRDLLEQMAKEADDVTIDSDSQLYRLPSSCSHLTSSAVGDDCG